MTRALDAWFLNSCFTGVWDIYDYGGSDWLYFRMVPVLRRVIELIQGETLHVMI